MPITAGYTQPVGIQQRCSPFAVWTDSVVFFPETTMNENKRKANCPPKRLDSSIQADFPAAIRQDHTGRISAQCIRRFQRLVLSYYEANKRELPWRKTSDPYWILVSEIMLQQTQVDRVIEKYQQFIRTFPDVASLARAPFTCVLNAWLGLGYNRRAMALKRAAENVMEYFDGNVPSTEKELLSLPGVGKYTAAAIMAFAFNQPVVVLDTNVRAVFIHHFFEGCDRVTDEDIAALVCKTLDTSNPRQWYNALMDYGAMLKKLVSNPGRRSAHYMRQSSFVGSDRQLRARILRLLADGRGLRAQDIIRSVGEDVCRVTRILFQLERERFIVKRKGWLRIAEAV